MRIFLTLLRRELAAFFFSLTGYVIIAAVTLLIGESFTQLMDGLGNKPWPMPVTQMFFNTIYFWLIVLLTAPVITMRLFALEKATGTFETLMTTPVSDLQVVAAKFAAAIIFYIVMWLPLIVCLFIVRHFTSQAGALDAGTIGGMFLGIFLIGGMFLSFGCLASAMTQSQMVAAMVNLAFGVSLFALGWWAKNNLVSEQWQSQILSCFGLFDQMNDFARGVLDTRTVVFYSSLTMLFLFLTLRAVESRRWK
jgi:ABC-2 type transport system permease protein